MINMFDVQADGDFVTGTAKERYQILKSLIDDGMEKTDAIRHFDSLHIPDDKHDFYLDKLINYERR